MSDVTQVLASLRPGAAWVMAGTDYAGLEWLDENQEKPTEAEVAAEMGRLAHKALVPATVTPRQMLLGLMAQGLITEQEALDAAKAGAVPASVQAIFDTLPTSAERVSAAITWAKMSVVERDHPLVNALAQANNLTEAETDDFFIACAKL